MADDGKPLDLYETDFYAWTQAQAALLRAQTGGGLDWARVAEEIEDMGKRDRREVFSRSETIIEHLLKLASTSRSEPQAGWLETIERERLEIESILTPTLRRHLEAELEHRHIRAVRKAQLALATHEPGRPIDATLRWSVQEILGESGA